MSRKALIRTNQFPYHVTARSNNKEWFYIPLESVWRIFLDALKSGVKQYRVRVISYVLMNNHFHILLWTPESNVDQFMRHLLKKMADQINYEAARVNHVFGGPYKWCLVTDQTYYMNVMRYICQNPIRANIVSTIDQYPFLKIPDVSDVPFRITKEEFEKWLNIIPNPEESEGIQKALYRRVFSVGRNQKTRSPYKIDAFHS